MTLTQFLRESEALFDWLDRSLQNLGIEGTLRSLLAVGCLDLASEHHKAIVLNIARTFYGSAFALERLLCEAYIRGVWLHRCASETDLERFKADKQEKSIAMLIEELERLPGFELHILSTFKAMLWKALNSYTHSGYQQIVRRYKEERIEPNYAPDEIMAILTRVNTVGLMAAIEMALVAENLPLANAILGKLEWFDEMQRQQ